MDDDQNGPCTKLYMFYITTEEPDSLDLLQLYMKRRFESDLSQLYKDLLRIVSVDCNEAKNELSSATAAAIAHMHTQMTTLLSQKQKTLPALCQHVWQGIKTEMSIVRGRMIGALLKHAIFVPVDLQQSIAKAFIYKLERFFPSYHTNMALKRLKRINSTIKTECLKRITKDALGDQQQIDSLTSKIKTAGEAESWESVRDVDQYLKHIKKQTAFNTAMRELKTVCILHKYKYIII